MIGTTIVAVLAVLAAFMFGMAVAVAYFGLGFTDVGDEDN